MSCILFLNFDGVTHPDPCLKDEYFRQLPLIEDVLREHADVNVVISSSWRYDYRLPELQAWFSPDLRSRVIDVTPSVARTDDAAEWFTPECAHLMRTQSLIGFQEEQAPVLNKMIKERLDSFGY